MVVSDSGAKGHGFNTYLSYLRRVVSLSKIHLLPEKYMYWLMVIPRKRWLRPDMTENVDWDIKHQHKQTKHKNLDFRFRWSF